MNAHNATHQRQIDNQRLLTGTHQPIRFIADSNGCWIFSGYINRMGYGLLRRPSLGQRFAHRLAWSDVNGKIPPGLCVMHKCDVPACVNPDHLCVGTVGDNNADRVAKGRSASQFGEANGRAMVSAADAALIASDPRLQRVIAAEFGIAQTTVSAIKRGATWGRKSLKGAK